MKLADGQGQTWNVLGELVTRKADAQMTNNTYSLFEVHSPPRSGPPLHVHSREDEAFYVLDGELLIQSGHEQFQAHPGAFIYFPRGTPHTYQNISPSPARILVITTPAGYENFFREMATLPIPTAGPPDFAQVIAIAERFGVQIVGPPLAQSRVPDQSK